MTCSSSLNYGHSHRHQLVFTGSIIIFCAVTVILINTVNSQGISSNASPCPSFFTYQYNENSGEYWGLVQVPSPPIGSTLHLTVNLSLNARLSTAYVGRLELYDPREVTIKRIINQLPVRYKVLFPLRYPYPRLTYITYNNHVLCSGDTGYNFGGYVTQISLEHKLFTTLAGGHRGYPIPYSALQSAGGGPSPNSISAQANKLFQPQPTVKTTTTTTTSTPAPPPQTTTTPSPPPPAEFHHPVDFGFHNFPSLPDLSQDIDMRIKQTTDYSSCGRVDPQYDITLLVLGGQEVERGQWPWLTAIHVYQQTALNFRCGGNLISNKHVVSAAHCFKNRESMQFSTDDIVVSLGQHNIRKLHDPRTISMGLESLNVHPEFLKDPKGSYDADIAILVLERAVTFSEFIKPVCLWSGPTDEQAVFGKSGVVVGWGKDESGQLVTKAPKRATIPIVSHLECIRSSETFLRITSARTLCGGGKNDAGPCNGDSGGGLMMFEDGVWQLRGIISVALADPVTGMCNLRQYVVFTDVAKFHDWIYSFIK